MEVVKITKKNLAKYYDRQDGNLWYREKQSNDFQILDDRFSVEECQNALAFGLEMIFISVNWGRRSITGYDAD